MAEQARFSYWSNYTRRTELSSIWEILGSAQISPKKSLGGPPSPGRLAEFASNQWFERWNKIPGTILPYKGGVATEEQFVAMNLGNSGKYLRRRLGL